MKVLVTGAGGMLAHALVPALRAAGHEAVALDRAALDVTDEEAVRRRVLAERPDAVVQCAAYTAVDRAEADEASAFLVNETATGHVARACQISGSSFVFPSTDYVFSGREGRPYRPEDAPDPLGAYGRSKAAGEAAARAAERHLVVRTSWLYGEGGRNFVDTMRRLATERDRLDVVDDQWGRPTRTTTLAHAIIRLLEVGARGTFHVTDSGNPVTWCGFAREILESRHPRVVVRPVTSAEYPQPAARPAYSVLDCSGTEAATGAPLPDWRETLAAYLDGTAGPGPRAL